MKIGWKTTGGPMEDQRWQNLLTIWRWATGGMLSELLQVFFMCNDIFTESDDFWSVFNISFKTTAQ